MKMNQEHKPCGESGSGTLYRIGAFASMNRVTVKALRFYEEQGLLYPATIDPESGYRYYTLNQMAALHQISALKQAGFTLEEIVKVNNGTDEEAIIIKKKSELLTEIAKLTSQAAALDGYLAKKKGSLTAPVLIKSIPECTVAYVQTKLDSYDCLFEKMPEMGRLMEKAGCICSMPEYCFTNYLEPGYKEEDIGILVELCEAVTEPKEEIGDLRYKQMPAIQAACIFHKGSYNTLAESYETVLKYIEDNDYKIVGEIRENYIDGVWNKESENEWLTEIQVPVDVF
ncbi:MAG: MerR family transcriptional regulator [Lachnospiraceae bacterium]|nr:MerR family transcriptional regulator [Lachnospiraceae bacterium]